MTIEQEIKEAVEEAIEPLQEEIEELKEAEEQEQEPPYLVPEHEHPGINERLSVLETRCDGMDSRLFAIETPPVLEDIMPEPEPEPEPEDDQIIDAEPEEEPEPEEEEVQEDTTPKTWYQKFFGTK